MPAVIDLARAAATALMVSLAPRPARAAHFNKYRSTDHS